ncbi:MAG TPA: hypothetical protein PLR60_05650 [Syntrophorhabdaceae bacterium]|nr:hypothetical protein [Syntrophorhabdaceae bacterium]
MEISLKNLNFGVPAAERDDDLISCFVITESYQNITKGKKCIVLGNRGTGKSAVFRKLADEEKAKNNIIIQLAPEEYSYELLSNTLRKEMEGSWAKHGAYSAAWKYLIYVTIMKNLSHQGKRFKQGPEARIYNYLRDQYAGTDTNPIGMLISYLKRMEGIKIGKYEAAIKTAELRRLYSLEEIEPLINDIEAACRNKKVIVLIDELDKGWDASEDAIAFVSGLFQAAVSINNKLNSVKILISLRKELYENIPTLYEDAQKVRDIIETIEWDEPKLLELIARRVIKKLPGLQLDSYENIWNSVFSEVLDYRQTKSFNYIVDRTLYRPREIIQYCNDVAEYSRRMLIPPPLPFNYKHIAEAEYGYSESRLKDICAEYRFQFPGLQSLMETFRGQSYNYDRESLEDHLLKVIVGEFQISREASSWCGSLDPETLVDILWSIGFIRAQAVGGLKARRRSGSEYLGSHQISSLNLRNIKRFHVHPMFRSYLGLKESKA